jgi:hypothetical protein
MQGAKAAEQTKTKVTIRFLLSLANGRRTIVNDGSHAEYCAVSFQGEHFVHSVGIVWRKYALVGVSDLPVTENDYHKVAIRRQETKPGNLAINGGNASTQTHCEYLFAAALKQGKVEYDGRRVCNPLLSD